MKPYKTYCGNHLYYISNNEVRCLYCDYTKDISKEPNPFKPFDSTALYEEDLKKEHYVNCSYDDIKAITLSIILKNPSLPNYMVLNGIQRHLYKMDLEHIKAIVNSKNNSLKKLYYRRQIERVDGRLNEYENSEKQYQLHLKK